MDNGLHTGHNKDAMATITNGLQDGQIATQNGSLGKGLVHSPSDDGAKSINAYPSLAKDIAADLIRLPPELRHITEGLISLPTLLARRAQVSHNSLNSMIQTLAEMPSPPAAVNGNHISGLGDQSTIDNIKKKVALLQWAEKEHADWVKVLVITSWSRVADDVGKLIDLKVRADEDRLHYDWAVDTLVELKRSLIHARIPNPDLKTALEILTTGQASWMPDLGYLINPPLTAQQVRKSFKTLDTLLSIRLSLHEHDTLPYHFRNFRIKSGRATFVVAGEFELDLTIADEDPAAQFWFIDFRFIFAPLAGEVHEVLRNAVEGRINAALEKHGLTGAYNFMHELTLTHKLSLIRQQAVNLSRSKWMNNLKVEGLHRALSIQYWVERFGPGNRPFDWVVLGVHSGRPKDGKYDPKATSYINMRWWRNKQEVEQVDVTMDLDNISAEDLVKEIIRRHSLCILQDIHDVLLTKPLYRDEKLALSLSQHNKETEDIHIKVELTVRTDDLVDDGDIIKIRIEPISGRFAISGSSRTISHAESRMNRLVKDTGWTEQNKKLRMRTPVELAKEVELLRCAVASERIISRAIASGWRHTGSPGLGEQDLQPILPKDTLQVSWLQRPGWLPTWSVAFTSSMSGERFWLLQTKRPAIFDQSHVPDAKATTARLVSHIQIPLSSTTPSITFSWFVKLHVATAAIISVFVNLQTLHDTKVPYRVLENEKSGGSSSVSLPIMFAALSKIVKFTGQPWAKDIIKMRVTGTQTVAGSSSTPPGGSRQDDEDALPNNTRGFVIEHAVVVAQAMMSSPLPVGLDVVKHQVDKDISFHPTSGAFAVRLHHRVGESAIPQLREKISKVEQLVQFVRTAKRHSHTLHLENISLDKVDLSYAKIDANGDAASMPRHRATIEFSHVRDHLKIAFDVNNPHIRLLDMFTRVLNNVGLDGVATYIPLTLPLLRVCEKIELAWTDVENGDAILLTRAVDWHIIRYTMLIEGSAPAERKVDIEIKLTARGDESWWVVKRVHRHQPDYIDDALRKIWDGGSKDSRAWRGMRTSAIAQNGGLEDVIQQTDGVMREIAAMPAPVEVKTEVATTEETQEAAPAAAAAATAPKTPSKATKALKAQAPQQPPQAQSHPQNQQSQPGGQQNQPSNQFQPQQAPAQQQPQHGKPAMMQRPTNQQLFQKFQQIMTAPAQQRSAALQSMSQQEKQMMQAIANSPQGQQFQAQHRAFQQQQQQQQQQRKPKNTIVID